MCDCATLSDGLVVGVIDGEVDGLLLGHRVKERVTRGWTCAACTLLDE